MTTPINPNAVEGAGSILSTVAGPSDANPPSSLGVSNPVADRLLDKIPSEQDLAADRPYNATKASEYGEASRTPIEGEHFKPSTNAATGSTASEIIAGDKVGDGNPPKGENPTTDPLDRVRVDPAKRVLTTNQGIPVADNQNSLKAGLRGPTLLEDFILREKIMHFDHERIPERVVHARGSAAHGYFEAYDNFSDLTRAIPFSKKGKRTPVFVRFSTVAGERGSTDTARDVRGFAVKFYTEEGNWDLVGNNIPVFFIQDPMKFPDLVHAAKPEPHHAMPQAATAHDTFWDFASLSPEIAHMLMWVMSDRAIPRSYRTMQGFGVHTFRLVNAQGESRFVKFHWTPKQGTHSLVWDEAVRISGADPDFHRRDLWESIEAGNFPEWELGLQIFTEEQAASFPFDILDATKIVPEELVPLTPVGKLVLDRNPDNFFAETEQVAFCTSHVVPGIDFTNDPLLQGRNFSYQDTQLTRLGGPNFHEIPINSPIVQIQNNQRDGFHRQAINRGRVNYEPNSLGGGCPFQAGKMGFTSFPERMVSEDKVRGKPELFAEHYGQARLFWQSQTPVEQNHIVNAFRFELTRVQTPAVRERTLALLANINETLVSRVAEGLGLDVPAPLPLASDAPIPAYESSPPLSILSRPGQTGIKGRRVAILVGNGVDGKSAGKLYASLLKDGAVPRLVGNMLGKVASTDGDKLDIEISVEAGPSVMYDGVIIPDGAASAEALGRNALVIEFLREQYRHGKPILVYGAASALLSKAMLPQTLPDGSADPGQILGDPANLEAALDGFTTALAAHRVYARETDPPAV